MGWMEEGQALVFQSVRAAVARLIPPFFEGADILADRNSPTHLQR